MGSGAEESRLVAGGDDDEPVGLLSSDATFGDELVGGEPRRRRQPGLVQDAALDQPNRIGRLPNRDSVPVEIHERLVDRRPARPAARSSTRMRHDLTDTRWYFSMSTGRNAACGQSRAAREMGIAERTPYGRAS